MNSKGVIFLYYIDSDLNCNFLQAVEVGEFALSFWFP